MKYNVNEIENTSMLVLLLLIGCNQNINKCNKSNKCK